MLFAPALKTLEEVETVLGAVSKPLNVLARFLPDATLADYNKLGVSRISIGGALAGRIRQATMLAATRMFELGRFD